MSLNDLTDQELNELCCKALGWKQVDLFTWQDEKGVKWTANVLKSIGTPAWFCSSLDLIQQYLAPVLRDKGLSAERQYVEYLLAAPEIVYSGAMHDHDFQAMNAPARVRVLAFLQAMGVER